MRTALAIRMSAGVEAPVTSGRAEGSTCREVGSPHSPGGMWVGLASRA